MKRVFVLLLMGLMSTSIFAQAPQKMSYQAVVRDASNNLVTNTAVGMQISILQGTITGTAVYVETQIPTTSGAGLVSMEIGNGTVVSGTFSDIDWSNGPYYIKVETDLEGGSNYTISGTTQLMSVPYALYAEKSGDAIPGPPGENGNTVLSGTGAPMDSATGTDGDFYIDTDSMLIYGPRTSGAWGTATSLVGTDGEGGVTSAGTGISITGTGISEDPYVINNDVRPVFMTQVTVIGASRGGKWYSMGGEDDLTESDTWFTVTRPGTFKNLYAVSVNRAAIDQEADEKVVVTLLKNSVPTTLSITLQGPIPLGHVASDTINEVSVVPGDLITFESDGTETTSSSRFNVTFEFEY